MKKLFLMAAAAAMVFASCEKGIGNKDSRSNEPARMNVRISFPQSMGGTRAETDNAKASEKDIEVERVTVFIFDEDGNGVLGNATTFTDIANDFEANNNSYTLKGRIQTTAGKKHVYVGMNLPSSLISAATEDVLIEKASTLGLEGENSLAMLSGLATPTLVAQETDEDSEPTPSDNIVGAEVRRLVSKIAVTLGEDDEFTLNEDQADGATFAIIPDQYAVGAVATTFFPVERLEGGMLKTPGDDVSIEEPMFKAINGNGTDVKELDAFYVPEHADMSLNFHQSNLTHAVVRAEVTFAKWAVIKDGVVAFEEAGPLEPETSVIVFRNGDYTYFCKSNSIANAVRAELDGDSSANTTYLIDADGKIYTYYHIFLNESDNYAVKRNQFFDIKVTGAKGLGVSTAEAPDEPLIETTYLEVSVDVLDWEYQDISKVLGE